MIIILQLMNYFKIIWCRMRPPRRRPSSLLKTPRTRLPGRLDTLIIVIKFKFNNSAPGFLNRIFIKGLRKCLDPKMLIFQSAECYFLRNQCIWAVVFSQLAVEDFARSNACKLCRLRYSASFSLQFHIVTTQSVVTHDRLGRDNVKFQREYTAIANA